MLHRANVEALSKHTGCVRGAKSLEIELRWIEAGALRDGLAPIKHVLLSISGGRRKNELAVGPPRVPLKFGDEFSRGGDLAFLLRKPEGHA